MEDPAITQSVDTQGITMQKDAKGLTQLRKLQVDINTQEDSKFSPLMILRSDKNNRRFELHHQGRMVFSITPDGSMRVIGGSEEVYEAFKEWVEKSIGM